jgi:hypothetical protein
MFKSREMLKKLNQSAGLNYRKNVQVDEIRETMAGLYGKDDLRE